jgi:4-hydroxy-4-methyl-2-oxoglutarate aldolase
MAVCLSLIEQLREFETPLVTEAMAAMGCPAPEKYYTGNDVRLLTHLAEPMVGVALPLVADTSTPGNKADTDGLWECYEMMTGSPLPVVVAIQAVGSRPRHECILGDGMAKILKVSGSCGLVTNGGARDIERINKVGYPVFGSGTVSNHVALMYRLSREPVQISGVDFAPGDLVHADADGVVTIPREYHAGIVEACILARDVETRVHLVWRRSDKTPEEKRIFVTRMFREHYRRCAALMQTPCPA